MFFVRFIVGDPDEDFDEFEVKSRYVEFDHGVAEICTVDSDGYFDDRIEVPYDHLIEIKVF